MAAHVLDFDDCSNTMGGHPSAPDRPCHLGAGGGDRQRRSGFRHGLRGRRGGENKIGRAVNFHHYEKGWHPTATLGTFGAAAACGHLSVLIAERLATCAGDRRIDGFRLQSQFRHNDKALPCGPRGPQRIARGTACPQRHEGESRRRSKIRRDFSLSITAREPSPPSAYCRNGVTPLDLDRARHRLQAPSLLRQYPPGP